MNAYVPRPGSKTAAAVDYLLAHGAAATAIDIAEACDAERKNLPAQFKAAIENGLMEACDLPEGKGYRLRGLVGDGVAAPLAEAPAPTGPANDLPPGWPMVEPAKKPAKRAATVKKSLTVATPPAAADATEIRPYLGAMPKAQPGKPRKPKAPPLPNPSPARGEGLGADHIRVEGKMVAPSFRIGHFSDGSVCIEGPGDAVKITDDYDANRVSVMLSPEVALQLVRFIGAGE